jgi:autotransporter-associated beta strand protein
VERLETRLVPATHTWTGATSGLWSVGANWTGGSPAGDPNAVLVFPGGAANLANTNDLVSLTIQSITFSGSDDYTLGGNALTLNGGGISLTSGATTGTDMISLPIALGASQTWTMTNASRTLQVGGVISGAATAGLTKDGMGVLVLTANNAYAGTTTVAAGSLTINGSQAGSNVIVNSGAVLGGAGTVGTITTSGQIIPGISGPGILHSGNVTFNAGSSLVILLSDTTPGTGFSQLNVTGTVSLAGSPTLTVTLGSFVPTVGDTFTPLSSTGPITGTFNGLPDNAILTVSGRMIRVNYQVNAVILTAGTENTRTVVTSSPNPSSSGQPVTFTATVAPVVPLRMLTPSGTVTFMDGTNPLGTGILNMSGVATFTAQSLSAGTHSITAVYGGDANFTTSTSAPLTQTVSSAETTIILTSSANPSVFSQAVTLTATVTATGAGMATPTGTVTFSEGTTTLGNGTLDNNGRATFQTSTLAVGSHTITATYNGSTSFPRNTSVPLTQTVGQATTSTVVTSSLNPSSLGQSVTFTATVTPVSPATGAPTGTVSFLDGPITIGTATLSNGKATFSTSTLSGPSSHSITAVYSGDTGFTGSTSAVLVQTIVPPAPPNLNQNYVTQLYHDLLKRSPDAGGLTFWTGLLNQNQATLNQVALGFVNSPEFRMREVQDAYQQYLHRSVDPTGLTSWTQYLSQGHTLEQLQAQIAASPEYLQRRAGGNTNNYLATLFMDAFNRPLDQAGRAMFGGDFERSNVRRKVAERIFSTNEYRQDLVQSYYQRFLNRSADSVGLNASVAALQNGVRGESLIAVIVSSPEYLATRVPQSTATG